MIASVIIIILAFTWLLIESDFMRARLLAGADLSIIEYERKSWTELKPSNPTYKKHPFWLVCPDNMTPLCGWDWLKNTMHIIPEYKVELALAGVNYKLNVKSSGVLKDVMKANKIKKSKERR
uniref:Uncharacterized protein n=1 Tax=viral metagenome TaxID=1070528 RepID=A0A6M3LLF2_9ZZZZ